VSASGRNRLLEALQWFGILGAALAWSSQHVLGYGVTEAACGAGGTSWGIANDTWQIAIGACAGTVILGAEAAAVIVFRRTRGADHEGDPPLGRMQFFATAAIVANVLFLCIVALDTVASIYGYGCRQS
jgi:hypothetical protein